MSTSLKTQLDTLAASFAQSILLALREATLDELAGAKAVSAPARAAAASSAVAPKKGSSSAAPPRKKVGPAKKGKAPSGKGGARVRRSAEQLGGTVDRIVDALRSNPSGLRSEHLQVTLGLKKAALVGPLRAALADKRISKQGERRATTYFAK